MVDAGVGIPPTSCRRGGKFVRAPGATGGGSGMGLADRVEDREASRRKPADSECGRRGYHGDGCAACRPHAAERAVLRHLATPAGRRARYNGAPEHGHALG